MNLTSLIIQLISGALGGNAVGSFAKNLSMGPVGNTVAGAIGGGLGGQLLHSLLGFGTTAAASGLDLSSVVQSFLSGGISGGLLALVAGLIRSKLAT